MPAWSLPWSQRASKVWAGSTSAADCVWLLVGTKGPSPLCIVARICLAAATSGILLDQLASYPKPMVIQDAYSVFKCPDALGPSTMVLKCWYSRGSWPRG